ncbi:MAG: hypothetical protein DMG54_25900 [Acidobacteria bacterium]|nr:MAG: hypothetical protein DMG54_25900 [Acidobacteriota bacterium]
MKILGEPTERKPLIVLTAKPNSVSFPFRQSRPSASEIASHFRPSSRLLILALEMARLSRACSKTHTRTGTDLRLTPIEQNKREAWELKRSARTPCGSRL